MQKNGEAYNGEAYSVRYSNTRKVESLYFASKVNNDYIIRSAIDMKDIKLLEKNIVNTIFL